MILPPHEIQLWFRAFGEDPGEDAAYVEDALKLLTAEERAHSGTFSKADSNAAFIAARGFLRTVLSYYLNVPPHDVALIRDAKGKPHVAAGVAKLNFSLSRHDLHGILVAVSAAYEIGVDGVLPVSKATSRELLASMFPAHAETADPVEAFARLWTQCEALAKARGSGFETENPPMEQCRVDLAIGAWRAVEIGGENFALFEFALPGTRKGALALRGVSLDAAPASEWSVRHMALEALR